MRDPSMCCAAHMSRDGLISGSWSALCTICCSMRAKRRPLTGGKVEVTAGEVSGAITISVADNGPGIAESIRERLFHPFVSYGKENGTGLGLAVVQKIVQDHGGEIYAERTAEGKTVFRMVLPGRVQETIRGSGESDISREVIAFSRARAADGATQNSISHPGL